MNRTTRAAFHILAVGIIVLFIGVALWRTYPGLFLGPAISGLFVAGGTAALAASAYYTIEWDREKHEKEESWRDQLRLDRKQDREPHIEILAGERILPRRAATGEGMAETESVEFHARTLVLRNNGPGIAANFKAKRAKRILPAEVLIPPPGPPDPWEGRPLSRDRVATDETREDTVKRVYLRADEEVVLESPDEWIAPPDPFIDETYLVYWTVDCTDLDGNPAKLARGGLKESEPLTKEDSPEEDIEWDRNIHRAWSRWYFVADLAPLPVRPPAPEEPEDTVVETSD